MSSSACGLLLLPPPPQNTSYSHIWIALYPSLRSTISHMVQTGCPSETTATLEIVIPITRLIEGIRTRRDLLVRVRPLVFNIYRLIATVHEELDVPQSRLDTRVLFVQDLGDASDDGNWRLSAAILSYDELALLGALWTRIFAVQSEQGEETYRKFLTLSRQHDLTRGVFFAKNVQRVASGIQIYMTNGSPEPSTATNAENVPTAGEAHASPRDAVVIVRGETLDRLTDKYLLTMALFAICPPKVLADGARDASAIFVVKMKGAADEKFTTWITDFLEAMTGALTRGLQVRFEEKPPLSSDTLIVCDSHDNLEERWQAEAGAILVLESVRPVDVDVED
ncbi:hypothetical protein F4861DRAFT_524795 [Xylaria intraflava]|nr:hypothetical protein F4861DRAFT_524795 [Xylaria intraflava]